MCNFAKKFSEHSVERCTNQHCERKSEGKSAFILGALLRDLRTSQQTYAYRNKSRQNTLSYEHIHFTFSQLYSLDIGPGIVFCFIN